MISEKEFNEWLQHPVTLAVRDLLEKKRDTLRRQWEGGSFTDYARDTTVLVNVANMGTCKGYAFVAELEFQDILTEVESDGEQFRAEAPRSSGVA